MDQAISTAAAAVPEDTRIARQFGPIEFIRRLREDELSILVPEVFSRNLLHQRLLFLDSFFINQPDYIEHVLLANHRNYRKSHFQRNILGPLLGEGLLLSEGAFWQRQRRFAAPAFHHRRIADFVAAMTSCAATALERWRGRTEAFDVTREMMALTLDIIARTMFSADISGEVAAMRRLMDVVIARKPSLLDLLGLPAWVPRGEAQVHRRAVAEFDALVARLLAERRRDATDRGDLLAMLLAACDPETGEGMTRQAAAQRILTIFLAGHETTANALSWTWYLLARRPEAEVRLHAEIDQVLGGRVPSFADLAELTSTRMVFEEAMRLYPPAYAIARAAIGEDRIGGVRIPPGATISIWPYVTHRNPKLWPEPERFDPERFSPEAVARRHRFAYLPFGGGPRVCIGNSFAIAEAQVIIAAIAQRFRLRLAPGHPVRPIGLVTLRAKDGIWVTLEPRQPLSGDDA